MKIKKDKTLYYTLYRSVSDRRSKLHTQLRENIFSDLPYTQPLVEISEQLEVHLERVLEIDL